ncbi:MAG: D-aminoacyl-tRNA deacylase, partial [Gammaproteobacteria bacterium]|nr:D-aminoacyl-tRNA deacylase [Gammaproteobacteria bacterium]
MSTASVSVDAHKIGEIQGGLLLLVGFGRGDAPPLLAPMTDKILNLRVFPDRAGRFQHSVLDTGGDLLAIPQFTLYADTRRG